MPSMDAPLHGSVPSLFLSLLMQIEILLFDWLHLRIGLEVYIYIYIYIYIYVCVYIYVCGDIYVCMYVCVCVRVGLMFCQHTHTYTYSLSLQQSLFSSHPSLICLSLCVCLSDVYTALIITSVCVFVCVCRRRTCGGYDCRVGSTGQYTCTRQSICS
jgi:hypothetical protein